jgi:hypothetical protein
LFLLLSASLPAFSAGKPNILFIVGDDMGYADVGFHGCREIPTPNLDALAASGVRFTSGYVSGPYCSPARAALLTGRYQSRFGHEFNPFGGQGMPLTETTIADRLKAAGYVTGLVGKWHLGAAPEMRPPKRGFDGFYGFLGDAHFAGHPYVKSPNLDRLASQSTWFKQCYVAANNILHVGTPKNWSASDNTLNSGNDFDHDLCNGRVPQSQETHAVRGESRYLAGAGFDPATRIGRFQLTPDSPGAAAGQPIPNFSDGYTGNAPDIGAHQRGALPMQYGVRATQT